MAPLFAALIKSGLGLVANAAIVKGTAFLEERTGLKIDVQKEPSAEELTAYKHFMLENERALIDLQLADNKLSADVMEKVIEANIAEDAGITERWKADATGDTLTKRIRPAVLIYLLLLFSIFAVGSAFEIKVGQEYTAVVSSLLQLVFGAYFGGRTAEKIAEMYYNHKIEIGKR